VKQLSPEEPNSNEKEREEVDFSGSTLLTIERMKVLSSWTPHPKQKWTLIYNATKDGFESKKFHEKCNNKGPTITLICSNGYLFGGYTSVSWCSSGGYVNDSNAFIFLLNNANGSLPTKFEISSPLDAIYNETLGPTFGGGHDICVSSDANINSRSYTNFPHSYKDSLGLGNNTFTGSRNLRASDVEVFSIVQ